MASNRKKSKKSQKDPLLDIPEADQWRIIRDSGILQKLETNATSQPEATPTQQAEEHLLSPFWEEFFAATSLIIPHCFLLLMMEILAHYQYGRKPTLEALADRMIPGIPIICIGIWYSNRHKNTRWMQSLLFALGVGSGSRLIWLLNHANWRDVMRFTPPLATAWIYATMQLNLTYAVLSLLATYGFIWYKNLRLFPSV
ncbi:hypothetical protein BDY19DRAFT_927704 [Irpex rosettiformis]|uniref:Uncharacterized protein n=1 Tax=Irpex rosettiformis TaxID=378272 RepID=A0ACB8UCD5_9APHY|nr:hypothetical protein BDY19DRAFT_927704 [Irpex rosettiformis]